VGLDATIRDLALRLLRYGLARTGDPDLAGEIAQDCLAAPVRKWCVAASLPGADRRRRRVLRPRG